MRSDRDDAPFRPNDPERGPDLDQFMSSLGGGGGGILRRLPRLGGIGPGVILIVIAILWLGSGFYQVDPASQAIVRIFGVPQPPEGEGLHWRPPSPIAQVDVVKVQEIRSMELGFRTIDPGPPARFQPVPVEALMITGDTNIVDVEMVVQYRVRDLDGFLFNVADPGDVSRQIRNRPDGRTLRDATEAALRQVVGSRTLDDALTVERAAIEGETMELLQQLLDIYSTGISIERVQLQIVKPPQPVEAAFLDVVSAREEKEQLINQARAYEADIIPKAQGEAEQMIREAEAYKETRIAQAEGDSARFLSILAEYSQARDVTRARLYLEAMERILPNIRKFVITPDASGGVLQLLPLEGQASIGATRSAPAPAAPPAAPPPSGSQTQGSGG